jgi:hypothetical protein
MGVEVLSNLKYRFMIGFKENEIQLTFISVGEGSQTTEPESQHPVDPKEQNAKREKAYADLKVNLEVMMNELSASLVAFLDN